MSVIDFQAPTEKTHSSRFCHGMTIVMTKTTHRSAWHIVLSHAARDVIHSDTHAQSGKSDAIMFEICTRLITINHALQAAAGPFDIAFSYFISTTNSSVAIGSLAPGRYTENPESIILPSATNIINIFMEIAWWIRDGSQVNTGSGKGLVPPVNKPLPDPKLG